MVAAGKRSKYYRAFAIVTIGGAGLLLLALGGIVMSAGNATGKAPSGARLQRIQASPQFREGSFVNDLARHDGSLLQIGYQSLVGRSQFTRPQTPLPIVHRSAQDFAALPDNGLRVTWLGHSSVLIELDGKRVLVDPVWGERASPLTWLGPKRFHPPPIALAELPPIDAVVISHDHYDHLDYPTITQLAARKPRFVVPLGVGAHLEAWGIPASDIEELDWWEAAALDDVQLVATPARHFSGRSLTFADKNRTLWSGWAITGPTHRVYYSGDTAMFPGFSAIGERLGPFDLTLIESGAYDPLWTDVHLGPEQAVDAHLMVRGKRLMPVHWGTFNLAFHGWTEPVERLLAKAAALGVDVVVPRQGQSVELESTLPLVRWWPEVPWQTAAETPVISSGIQIHDTEAAELVHP